MWLIAYRSTRHVGRHRGTLPVVLACPHDGGAALPVPERTGSGLPPRLPLHQVSRFSGHGDHDRHCATAVGAARGGALCRLCRIPSQVRRCEPLRRLRLRGGGSQAVLRGVSSDAARLRRRGACGERRARAAVRHPRHRLHRQRSRRPVPGNDSGPQRRPPAQRAMASAGCSRPRVMSSRPIRPRSAGTIRSRLTAARTREGIDAIQIEIVAALRASTAKRGVLIDDLARAIASLVDNDVLDGRRKGTRACARAGSL